MTKSQLNTLLNRQKILLDELVEISEIINIELNRNAPPITKKQQKAEELRQKTLANWNKYNGKKQAKHN